MRMTGSISCCRKRTYGPLLPPGVLSQRRSPNRSFVRSGAGCRPSICGWRSSCVGVCLLTECTLWPPLGSPNKNSMLCFLTGLPGAATRIRTKKKLIGLSWTCTQRSPSMVGAMQRLDVILQRSERAVGLWLPAPTKALSDKEAEAHSDVDAFMEHCAKRWQTREGTYQLKRRRLKPDVRDPPEDGSADVDMADIWTLDGLEDYYMVEENLWGAERGAFCFTLSHLVLRFSLVVVLLLVFVGWCAFGFCFSCCFLVFQGKICI